MNAKKAAELLLNKIITAPSIQGSEQDPEGKEIGHAVWMLAGIRLGYIQYEKAHRWLGYAQGILVKSNIVSLEVVKSLNQEASK